VRRVGWREGVAGGGKGMKEGREAKVRGKKGGDSFWSRPSSSTYATQPMPSPDVPEEA